MDSDGYIDPDLFFWSKDCQMPNNTSLNVGVLLLHLDEMQVYHTLPPPPPITTPLPKHNLWMPANHYLTVC